MEQTNGVFIPILLGTSRQGRQSEPVARLILDRIQSGRSDIQTRLFDPRDMDLPPDDEGTALADRNPEWRDAMIRADGLIIIAPEYNHGYAGSLKRALDVLLKEYIHKAVGLVGVSSTWSGGVRSIESLVQVTRELGLAATFSDLYFPRVNEAFNPDGTVKDPRTLERIDAFLEELAWMSLSLKWGRDNLPSKYR